jgi:hypothetical protein
MAASNLLCGGYAYEGSSLCHVGFGQVRWPLRPHAALAALEDSMALQEGGVSKTYITDVQALKDVTPTIPAAMHGRLGPNGAGRSA